MAMRFKLIAEEKEREWSVEKLREERGIRPRETPAVGESHLESSYLENIICDLCSWKKAI